MISGGFIGRPPESRLGLPDDGNGESRKLLVEQSRRPSFDRLYKLEDVMLRIGLRAAAHDPATSIAMIRTNTCRDQHRIIEHSRV